MNQTNVSEHTVFVTDSADSEEKAMAKSIEKRAKLFWESDLSEIEKSFLKGRKITDLPSALDDRVPNQGSMLLDQAVNIDHVIPKSNLFLLYVERLVLWLRAAFIIRPK